MADQITNPGANTRWFLVTLGLTVIFSLSFVLLNVRLDLFGLYGKDNARVHTLDRYSDHLLSYRYVPDHFDEILLGNSVTTDWDTSLLPAHRIFNFSTFGSNLHEQKIEAENMIRFGHLRTAYILLHPTMMNTVALPTAYLGEQDRQSAFGSTQLLLVYARILSERLAAARAGSALPPVYFPSGGRVFAIPRVARYTKQPPQYFLIHPQAVADLRDLLTEFREHGIRVYFIVAPLYKPLEDLAAEEYRNFREKMRAVAGPDMVTFDLDSDPSLQALRTDDGSYPDFTHLTPAATRPVLMALAKQMEARTK